MFIGSAIPADDEYDEYSQEIEQYVNVPALGWFQPRYSPVTSPIPSSRIVGEYYVIDGRDEDPMIPHALLPEVGHVEYQLTVKKSAWLQFQKALRITIVFWRSHGEPLVYIDTKNRQDIPLPGSGMRYRYEDFTTSSSTSDGIPIYTPAAVGSSVTHACANTEDDKINSVRAELEKASIKALAQREDLMIADDCKCHTL